MKSPDTQAKAAVRIGQSPDRRRLFALLCARDFGRALILLFFSATIFSVSAASAAQLVWLDFSDHDLGEHIYTAAEQIAIRDNIAADFQEFDYAFTLTKPLAGDYSTLIFNADGIAGGLSDGIDFRNLNSTDNALININSLLGDVDQPAGNSANFIGLASTVGAHELGHLAGLRHGDSMGPIGSGISPVPGTGDYLPVYPGPTDADETVVHTMASPMSVGQTLFNAVGDTFFSERSAVKLTFNEAGSVVAEQLGVHDSLVNAQPLALAALSVSNTLLYGDNFGKTLTAAAVAVTGTINAPGENDFYSFSGTAGDLMNFEVISSVVPRIFNTIDSEISFFDSAGILVTYFTSTATNDDEFESGDSILVDLTLPATDTYYVKVNAYDLADLGDYELFAYRFAAAAASAVPEPGTWSLLAFGLLAASFLYDRRRGRLLGR